MKFHIHIGHHFFGAGNFGDDLMVAGFLHVLRPHLQDIRLTCCIPHDRLSQQNRFPEIEWCEYNAGIREEMIQRCDVWLGLGDTPFQTDVGMWFLEHLGKELEYCKRYSKQMYFLCVGINDKSALQQEIAHALVDYAAHIWSRDEQATEILGMIRGKDSISIGSDLAHIFLQRRSFKPTEPNTVAYLLIFENKSLLDIGTLQKMIVRFSDRKQRWLFQEVRNLPGSENELMLKIEPNLQKQLDVRIPDYQNDTLDRYLERWGNPELLITSRYHATIIGAWMGCKVIAVERNDKISGLVSQIKTSNLRSLESPEDVLQNIHQCKPVSRALLNELADLATSSCRSFLSSVKILS